MAPLRQKEKEERKKKVKLTSIRDLAGVAASGRGTPLWEGNPDLAEGLGGRPGPDTLVPADNDLLFNTIRPLELGLDRRNLVIEPALLLRMLGLLKTVGGEFVHLFSGDTEVAADVLTSPSHRFHAIHGLLALRGHGLVEGLLEGVSADCHGLCANSNANVDVSRGDRVGDIGSGLEA